MAPVVVSTRQFIVVAGKGGVGRSTVALAIGLAAAREGRRVAVVEVHGARALAASCGVSDRALGLPVAAGLELWSLDSGACLGAYASDRSALAPLAGRVLGARVVRAFLDAVPGMGDLLHLGLLNALVEGSVGGRRPYDLVVVDAPPTGHGLAFTATARAMVEMTREGPIHDEAERIADRLADPARSAQVVVTLPESLPISELRDLLDGLGEQRPTVAAVAVNRVDADPFDAISWPRLREALDEPLRGVGDRLARAVEAQAAALDEARRAAGATPVVTLPRLDAVRFLGDLGPLAARFA